MTTNILSALGSASGIDTIQLVKDLVGAQKAAPQARLDSRTEDAQAQLSAYGILKSSLAEFQSILTPLSDPNLFEAKSINVPDTDVVSFNSLTAEAQAGSYQLEVEQIASAQSIAFNSTETDSSQALGKTGTLTFSLGEWSGAIFSVDAEKVGFTVVITDDDTLDSIAGKINDADSNVLASVITIDGKLQLLITSESGAKNALEITSDNTAQLGVFEYNSTIIADQALLANPTIIETQSGQDSIFKLNGLEINRESNTISDAIVGLDFTLNKADVGNKVSFSISQDKSSAETAIRELVEAYNILKETLGALVGVSKDDDNNTVIGDLAKDGTAKSLVNRLSQAISSTVSGMSPLDGFSALASVGVTTNLDGTLKIDEEQFKKVISENFDKLGKLFGVNTSSDSSFITLNTGSFASNATAGEYVVDITQTPTKGTLTGTVMTFPLDLSASAAEFAMKVDGVSSNNIILSGSYSSIEELAADLQSSINSDTNFKDINLAVDVTVDAGKLIITSRSFGSSSSVEITNDVNGNLLTAIGLNTSSSKLDGIDVKGTINGEEAFGSSNILLPAVGSSAYGLNIEVAEGTPLDKYTVSFSRGLAGDMALLISTVLSDNGQIANREDRIESEKKNITGDQERLDRKMTAYHERLSRQYVAMERIIASLKSTESQLDGLIDRLPFTASK
ncbi:MAG: flagellar filament capping protein FliD [Moritella sp.]|uniref:flagellar filament capping protein FliD n=1 Tax=Moritella sp. TaxID=78556 RepID=UPI001D8A8E03|nr:flagellar filament capping protein FliD [Moritella sp.]NQZ51873.1 flagellar filament capping protein FliD [Moritella sp.]